MAKGVTIGVAEDSRDFASGIRKGVIKPLEDAEKAIEELGRESESSGDRVENSMEGAERTLSDIGDEARKAGDKIESAMEGAEKSIDDVADESKKSGKTLEDSMRDAQAQTEKLGKEHRDLADVIRDSSKRGSNSMKQNSTEATSVAKRDLVELGDEAKQNASEVFSSFDGSAQSFADGIQGTLGGIVSNMGVVGAGLGAAGALAIGLFMADYEKAQERLQESRERIGELTNEMIELGSSTPGLDRIITRMQDYASETDEARMSLADLAEVADLSDFDSIDLKPLAQGMSGDLEMLEGQLSAVTDEIDRMSDAQVFHADRQTNTSKAQEEQLELLKETRTDLEATRDEIEKSAAAYDLWVAAGGEAMQAQSEATQTASESIQDALLEAGGAYEDFIDDESGVLDTSAYLAAFEERAAAVRNYQANMTVASKSLNQEALNYIQSLGADAAPLLQAYIDAPLDQKQRLEEVWSTLGNVSQNSFISTLNESMPDSVEGPAVNVSNFRFNDYQLQSFLQVRRNIQVGVEYVARNGVPQPY